MRLIRVEELKTDFIVFFNTSAGLDGSGFKFHNIFTKSYMARQLQPDQINMFVLFWYLVKSDASVRYCTVAYTGQVTFKGVPEQCDHV